MRRLWYRREYRILRVSHFLRVIPAAPRIMGTVGITGRTGTRRADPGRAERGPAPG